ncbi:hypothetical protein PENSTE_c005G04226 [Penicillium steckii]|uniref:DUF7600 domain-containing protein n=1 Tax=Penicillium steckii TaxID=303698 RepID=A0A1V6TKF8_9EURO|nr:hypothetical protein PENSTE_c005G04226 [Penicillium steckii]
MTRSSHRGLDKSEKAMYMKLKLDWKTVTAQYHPCERHKCVEWLCIDNGHPRHLKFQQTVILHPSLYQIKVSVLFHDKRAYITGMELIFREKERPNQIFGHYVPDQNIMIDIGSPKLLAGFEVAKDHRGITAMRILTRLKLATPIEDSDDSKQLESTRWFGVPPLEHNIIRLVSKAEIIALHGKFDVSKNSH